MIDRPYEDDTYLDVYSSDKEIDEYIEREREEFRREWFEYVAEYD